MNTQWGSKVCAQISDWWVGMRDGGQGKAIVKAHSHNFCGTVYLGLILYEQTGHLALL